jgi:hypothetical protein
MAFDLVCLLLYGAQFLGVADGAREKLLLDGLELGLEIVHRVFGGSLFLLKSGLVSLDGLQISFGLFQGLVVVQLMLHLGQHFGGLFQAEI